MRKAKKTARLAGSKPTRGTSRPSSKIEHPAGTLTSSVTQSEGVKIEFAGRFLAELRNRGKEERKALGEAINAARDAWGHPHLHSGCGLRRLHGNFFECRSGLSTRLAFEWVGGTLRFHALGNHEEIRRLIKTL